MAGLTTAQALGEGWTQSLHPENGSRVLSQWYCAVKEKLPCKLEYRFCHGDLTTWVFCQAVPEIAKSGEVLGYLGTLTDLRDRKQAELALQQAKEDAAVSLKMRSKEFSRQRPTDAPQR